MLPSPTCIMVGQILILLTWSNSNPINNFQFHTDHAIKRFDQICLLLKNICFFFLIVFDIGIKHLYCFYVIVLLINNALNNNVFYVKYVCPKFIFFVFVDDLLTYLVIFLSGLTRFI